MNRWTAVIVFFAMVVSTDRVLAQDPEFSQFYANPLYLNPALAGASSGSRANMNLRYQWPGIGNAFVTYHGSFDMYLEPLHGGAGIDIVFDQAGGGNLNSFSVYGMYAYKFNITSQLQASGAVKAGYYSRYLNTGNLNTKEPDPYLNSMTSSAGAPDFGAGILLSYNNLVYGGVSVDHLTQPNVSFSGGESPLYMKLTLHAGSVINLGSDRGTGEEREFSISPNVLYQQQFNFLQPFHQLNLGMYLTFDPLIFGFWYRYNFENSDAIIPMLGIHWKSLRIAYSYDYNVSKLQDASGGAHEVSASWQFSTLEKRRKIRAIKCPSF